jgi:hypothetical protein
MHELRRAGDALRTPFIVAMLLLWALNDHVLKATFANDITGKLSDVAGLAVFPLIPLACYEIAASLRGHAAPHAHAVLWGGLVSAGLVMVLINTSTVCADAYRVGLGAAQWPFRILWSGMTGEGVAELSRVRLTMDPTDVWTLPALWLPWRAARSGHQPSATVRT